MNMDYKGTDFYCDVALAGKLSLVKEYESDSVLAYHHTKPFWPVHIIVTPKKHIASFTTLGAGDEGVVRELLVVLQTIAKKVENENGSARILTNLGAYQDSKHLHFHVNSGEPLR
jgi:histidine triad (HIT) family protein